MDWISHLLDLHTRKQIIQLKEEDLTIHELKGLILIHTELKKVQKFIAEIREKDLNRGKESND